MAMNITRRDVEDAFSHLRDVHSRVSKHSSHGERIVGQVVQTVEVSAGALTNGVLSGRYGNMTLGQTKIPLDLVLALGGHGLALFGIAGKHAEHLHNFADGYLAGYLTKLGAGIGARWAQKQGASPHVFSGTSSHHSFTTSHRSQFSGAARAPLTEAELTSLAQAIR